MDASKAIAFTKDPFKTQWLGSPFTLDRQKRVLQLYEMDTNKVTFSLSIMTRIFSSNATL